jgi:hypothetical protein
MVPETPHLQNNQSKNGLNSTVQSPEFKPSPTKISPETIKNSKMRGFNNKLKAFIAQEPIISKHLMSWA